MHDATSRLEAGGEINPVKRIGSVAMGAMQLARKTFGRKGLGGRYRHRCKFEPYTWTILLAEAYRQRGTRAHSQDLAFHD